MDLTSQASRSSLDDNIIEAQKVADSYRKIMINRLCNEFVEKGN